MIKISSKYQQAIYFFSFSLLVVVLSAAALPRFPGKLNKPETTNDKSYKYDILYFTQTLDHFSFSNNLPTFQQRYLINDDHWFGPTRLGPIFLYCGNEGDIEWFASNTGFVWEISPLFGALVVFPEHRYYGESMPYGSKEKAYESADSLSHLTAEQALADFAVLITDLKHNLSAQDCPVVLFGGSYGGMLAAWMRLKYPHIAIGALASSAPILQFEDIVPKETFYDLVSNDFKRESVSCFNTIKKSWEELEVEGEDNDGLLRLTRKFHLCQRLNSSEDLSDWLSAAYSYLAMVDYPYPSSFMMPLPGHPIKEVCKKIDSYPEGASVLERVFAGVSIYYNYTGTVECFDLGDDPHGMSGWDWQACTEMVMPMSSSRNNSMFPTYDFDYASYEEQCLKEFGTKPRPRWITTEFGGNDLRSTLKMFGSNIIFSNGLLDPWSGGGVLENISDTIVALVTSEGWRPDSISRPYDNIFSSTFQKIRDLGAAQSVILGIDPATATPLLSDPELASIGKYSAPFFRPPPPKERKPRITSPPQKKRRTAAPSHRHPPARHTTHRSTAPTPYRSLKTWEDQYSPSHSSSPSSPPSSMGANKRKLFDSDSDEDVVAAAPQSTIVPPSPPPASKRPRPSDHGEGPPSKAAIPPTAPPQVEQRPGKEVASRADKEADEPIPPFCPSFKLRNRTLTVKDSALKNPAVASSLFYGSHLPVDMAYAEGGSFESHRTSFYTGWEKMSLDISYMIRGLFGARARIDELDKEVADLAEKNSAADLDKLRAQDELRTAEAAHLAYMNAAALQRESLQEKHAAALDSLSQKHQEALEALHAQHEADMDELRDIYRAQAEKRVVKKVREEIDRLTKEGRLLPEAPATTPLPEVVVPVQDSASEGRDAAERVAEAIDTAADIIIEEAAESVIQDSIVP